MGLIKFILGFCVILIASIFTDAQTVIEMTHPNDAQLVLLKVDNKKDADIVVFKTKSKRESRQWDCLWKFKNWGFANLSIFIMNSIADTALYKDDENNFAIDGKIFFTENKEERGYNDPNFRLKGVFRKFKEAPIDNIKDSLKNVTPVSFVVNFNSEFSFSDNPQKFPSNVRIAIVDSLLINTFSSKIVDSNNYKFKQQLDIGYYNILVTSDNYRQFVMPFIVNNSDTALNRNVKISLIPNQIVNNTDNIKNKPSENILVVNNLFFDFDKYNLREESKLQLNKIAEIMKLNPTVKLELVGYTDSKGKYDYNLKLSKQRAKEAVSYLKKNGINANNLIYKGMGETNPVAYNKLNGKDSKDGRKYNRRVELKFVNSEQLNIKVEEIIVPENLKIKDNSKK